MTDINHPAYRRLKIMGTIEGISSLLLFFVAMPLKYAFAMPSAVKVVGTVHGGLFVVYCLLVLLCGITLKWPLGKYLIGWFAAIPPLGFLIVEKRLES